MSSTAPRRHYTWDEYLALDEASNVLDSISCRLDVDALNDRAGA